MKIYVWLMLALAFAVASEATAMEGVGALFELGTSARQEGMGGAGLALCFDSEAPYYNAASLGNVQSYSLTSMYVAHFGGVSYAAVGVAIPYFGLQILVLDSGPINSQELTFRYSTQGIIAAMGVEIIPNVVLGGLRIRCLRISSPAKAFGWALDPSLLVAVGSFRGGLMFEGIVSRDVAGSRMNGESWDRRVSAAIGYDGVISPLLQCRASVEVSDAFATKPDISAGLEFQIGKLLARVGHDGTGLTTGLSFFLDGLRLDCSYAGRRDLGGSYRMGITFDVGELLSHDEPGR